MGKFLKTVTYQKMTPEASVKVGEVTARQCEVERMLAHASRLRSERSGIQRSEKKLCHKVMVVSFLMGTSKLYRLVDDNPLAVIHTFDYVNDPFVIGQNHKIVSINSTLQVDQSCQVCADTAGFTQYSGRRGTGGFCPADAPVPLEGNRS